MTNPASESAALTAGQDGRYNGEVEMVALYAGGIFGGLAFGMAGDFLNSELNTMAWYVGGAVLGAIAGAIAGAVFRRLV